jgi:hypothetical protein
VFKIRLDDEDHEALSEILGEARGPIGEPFALEREPGGRHAVIMKTDLNRATRS